jgi:rSAM/selenodomain-associated transferase 2
MADYKISIIVPTLNEEANLGKLLQRWAKTPDLEIIISDGGSTDNTERVAGEWPVLWVSGPPGRGGQLNRGVQRASGDILLFLHADTHLEKHIFTDIRMAVRDGGHWGCCSLEFDKATPFFRILGAASRLRVKIFSSCYGDQGIFCKKDFFFQIGGFPEWPFLEDLAFSQKARKYSPAKIIPGRIITSTRRFQRYGQWRTLYKMQVVKGLYYLGVPPEKLFLFYQGKQK